jgi:hypothetical protein
MSDPATRFIDNALRPPWSEYDNELQRARRASARAHRLTALAGRPCAYCGQPFDPERDSARYCSSSCRSAAHRLRELHHARATLGD